MIQIPANQLFAKSNVYEDLANQYLPESDATLQIGTQQQKEAIEQLNSRIRNERFYIVSDIKSGAVLQCNGVNQWLGYTDVHFSQKQYHGIISPVHAAVQSLFAIAIFELLMSGQVDVEFLVPLCSATVALRHKDGTYLYCKRESYPFQLTENNRLTAYISEFTFIKEFTNEDFHIRLTGRENADTQNEYLRVLVKKRFEENAGFSIQELRILKRYAQNPKATSNIIAKAFKIEKATVGTYNKRVMKKAALIAGQQFDNARHAAAYFKRMQLI